MGRLSGQVAVVTGSGRGLGRAYARSLAEAGAAVVVNDKGTELNGTGTSTGPAESVVAEIKAAGGKAVANYEDVSDFKAAGRIVEAAVKHFGRLDLMITNAGADRRGPILDLTPEDWDATLKIHLYGSIYCAIQAGRVMRDQKSGAIIIITSEAFYAYPKRLAPYAVSKGGTYALMHALSQELQPFGVSVNAISPAGRSRQIEDYFRNRLSETAGLTEEQVEAFIVKSQDPALLGPLAAFLATPEGRKVTGKVFALRGDRVSLMPPPIETTLAHAPSGQWDLDSMVAVLPGLLPVGLSEVASPRRRRAQASRPGARINATEAGQER